MPATPRRRSHKPFGANRARLASASPPPCRARDWDVDGGANALLSDEMRAIKTAQMRTLGEQLSDETKAAIGFKLSQQPEPSQPNAPTSISPSAVVAKPSDLKKYGVDLEIPPYRDARTNTERWRERERGRWGNRGNDRGVDGEMERESERERDEHARVSSTRRPRPSAQRSDIYDPSQLLKMHPYVVVFKNSRSRVGLFLDWDQRTNTCAFYDSDSGARFYTQSDVHHFENYWHHAAW